MADADTAQPLTGRRIGVPESRQLDLFADMLERRGADVRRCPLVDIQDTPDADAVHGWIDSVRAEGLDDMIWLTGEGLRRIAGFSGRRGEDIESQLFERLGAARTITRGPKPVRELRARGMTSDIAAVRPTTDGVIAALEAETLADRRVGVQLYGQDPNPALMAFLDQRGAHALPVAPYIYADESEEPQVLRFIDDILDDTIDALAFTSSPQIKRLFKVARKHDRGESLIAAMNRCCIAAVGPLVADRLAEHGVSVTLMPESNYFMKPLVRKLMSYFSPPAV